jgi:hypothetical protein
MVSGNVCMSRRWKAEQVTYGSHVQTPARFMHLVLLKPNHLLVWPVCPEVFSTLSCLQKSIAIKPCIGIDRISNQWKDELVNGNFGIQSFLRGHGEILSKPWLMPKSRVRPEIRIQQIGRVPIVITHKLPTDWSCFTDHRKAERVTYWNGIRDF